jgi:nucleoside-diphosphate-sugar epimerase
VYVDDVVQAILRALRSDVSGEAFNISGEEVVTWSEYFAHLSRAIGWGDAPQLSRFRVWAEASLAHPLRLAGQQAMSNHEDAVMEATSRSSFLKRIARGVRSLIQETPSLSELRLFRRRATFPTDKARKHLGFEPATSLTDGMEITANWLHHHRLV